MLQNVDATVVGHFASHTKINQWLANVCTNYNFIATCGVVGKSYQKRKIKFIKVCCYYFCCYKFEIGLKVDIQFWFQ